MERELNKETFSWYPQHIPKAISKLDVDEPQMMNCGNLLQKGCHLRNTHLHGRGVSPLSQIIYVSFQGVKKKYEPIHVVLRVFNWVGGEGCLCISNKRKANMSFYFNRLSLEKNYCFMGP